MNPAGISQSQLRPSQDMEARMEAPEAPQLQVQEAPYGCVCAPAHAKEAPGAAG